MHKLWLLASTAGKGLLQCVLIVALTFLFCRTIPGDAVDVLGLEGGLCGAGCGHSSGIEA